MFWQMESKHYLRKSRNSRNYSQFKSIEEKPFLVKAEVPVGTYLKSQCNFSLWHFTAKFKIILSAYQVRHFLELRIYYLNNILKI